MCAYIRPVTAQFVCPQFGKGPFTSLEHIYILEDTIGTSSCSKSLATMVGFQTQETQSPLLLNCSGGLHFLLAEGKALICRQ